MRIEIEIDEEDLKLQAAQKTKQIAAGYIHTFTAEGEIRERVRQLWSPQIDSLIIEAFQDSEELREVIKEALRKKITSQLTALMKAADQ